VNDLTPEQRKKADAVAGGDFSKILIELQIIRASFSAEKAACRSSKDRRIF